LQWDFAISRYGPCWLGRLEPWSGSPLLRGERVEGLRTEEISPEFADCVLGGAPLLLMLPLMLLVLLPPLSLL